VSKTAAWFLTPLWSRLLARLGHSASIPAECILASKMLNFLQLGEGIAQMHQFQGKLWCVVFLFKNF
jgi:hypothetical protein